MAVKPIPDGYPQVTPYLCIDGASDAIAFYEKVLGAKERLRMPGPDGKLGHAEIEIGTGVVMLADEFPDMGFVAPKKGGGTSVTVSVYLEDADAVYKAALAAGATSVREPETQFYGDRSAQFDDPWGHRWNVSTHVEDVPPDEMMKRAKEMADHG
jgi:PhnB protein